MSVVCVLYQFYVRSSFDGYALLFRCNPQEGRRGGWRRRGRREGEGRKEDRLGREGGEEKGGKRGGRGRNRREEEERGWKEGERGNRGIMSPLILERIWNLKETL